MKTAIQFAWQKILVVVLVTLFATFAYTFLHEGGHALVVLLSGGSLTRFSANFWQLSAHIETNATLTPAQTLANNLAGVSLPLLVWAGFLLLMPRRTNFVLAALKGISSILILSTLWAWIILPLVALFGQAPAGDDVTSFLVNSGLPPLWVTLAALALLMGGMAFAINRLDGLAALRAAGADLAALPIRHSLLTLLGLSALLLLVVFWLNGFRLNPDPLQPPAGYMLLQKIDLSQAQSEQAAICEFSLAEPTAEGMYFVLKDIRSDYLDIQVVGPDGTTYPILHAEGYTATGISFYLEETLPPGRYTCLLTSRQSSGMLRIYLKDALLDAIEE